MAIRSFFCVRETFLGVDFLGSPQAALRKTDPARGGGKSSLRSPPEDKSTPRGDRG